jgi:hypothetical protein
MYETDDARRMRHIELMQVAGNQIARKVMNIFNEPHEVYTGEFAYYIYPIQQPFAFPRSEFSRQSKHLS